MRFSSIGFVSALAMGAIGALGCDPHGCPTGTVPQADGVCVAQETPDAGAENDAQATPEDAPDAPHVVDAYAAPDAFMPDAFLVIPDGCVPVAYWNDNDADGFGDAAISILACAPPTHYVTNDDDCNDASASVRPDATEVCNAVDDNCDGRVDEMLRVTLYADGDGDHYGTDVTSSECPGAAGWAAESGDCNDANGMIHPAQTEACNGIDDNCDGSIDEMRLIPVVRDADGDGYGSTEAGMQCPGTTGWATSTGDCNDMNRDVNPSALEACNTVDDNCNGRIDEGLLIAVFRDADRDGFGTVEPGMVCPGAAGWATVSGDCNDSLASINPGAREVCNGIDENCALGIDEMLLSVFYEDLDMDGYGARASAPMCSAPPGYVALAGDCDDVTSLVNPRRPEVCNGIDDNCARGPDDTFACVLGRSYTCATSCGTTGSYVCPAGCAVPACTPPLEACNYADDDCDDYVDEGASAWLGPTSAALSTRRVEVLTTATGFVRVLARSDGIWARNYDRGGAPVGVETRLTSVQPSVFAASVRNDSLYLATYESSLLWGHEFSASTLAPRVTNVSVASYLGALTRLRVVANDTRLFILYADSLKVEMMVRDHAWAGLGVQRVHDGAIDFDVALGADTTQAYVAVSVANGVQLTRVTEAGAVLPLTRHITSASTRFAQVAIGKMAGGRDAVGLAFHDNAGLASNVHFALYEADTATTVAPRGELSLEAITPSTTPLEGAMDLAFSGGRFTAAWLALSGTEWHLGDIRPVPGAPTGVLTTIALGAATTSLGLAGGDDGRLFAIHAQASAAARSWVRACR